MWSLYHRKICNVPQQMLDSTYMGHPSLPSFTHYPVTCYANAHFVSIDPRALKKHAIHILGSETKPSRLYLILKPNLFPPIVLCICLFHCNMCDMSNSSLGIVLSFGSRKSKEICIIQHIFLSVSSYCKKKQPYSADKPNPFRKMLVLLSEHGNRHSRENFPLLAEQSGRVFA